MKLRIRGNSLRLRLTKSEVAALAERGQVEDVVRFPGGARLAYAVAIDPSATAMGARFEASRIVVSLPRELAQEWTSTERVGVEGEQALEAGALRLLLEKDFACLQVRAGEDDSDAYANPNETCG